ncbi:hypothetical protein DFH06DRAFT_685988 [Mycena polygramma]|nr:hypothetical protein DFH06DRAFT_685988 [Mycena polygramma]
MFLLRCPPCLLFLLFSSCPTLPIHTSLLTYLLLRTTTSPHPHPALPTSLAARTRPPRAPALLVSRRAGGAVRRVPHGARGQGGGERCRIVVWPERGDGGVEVCLIFVCHPFFSGRWDWRAGATYFFGYLCWRFFTLLWRSSRVTSSTSSPRLFFFHPFLATFGVFILK